MPKDQSQERTVRVFLSYSWDSEEHKKWALEFAKRLRGDGFEAIIDALNLRLGARAPKFMETSVRDSDRVFVICTPEYKRRFDHRKGGAGYEGHIITGEIVNEVGKNKFIPILRIGEWNDSVPTALSGIHGVDLRSDSSSEYRKLVEELYDLNEVVPLGSRPTWLTSDKSASHSASMLLEIQERKFLDQRNHPLRESLTSDSAVRFRVPSVARSSAIRKRAWRRLDGDLPEADFSGIREILIYPITDLWPGHKLPGCP